MKGMLNLFLCMLVCFCFVSIVHADTLVTIDYPGADWTSAEGISNSDQITGTYQDSSSGSSRTYGYLYNRNTDAFTQINFPGSTRTYSHAMNNSGSLVVGRYVDAAGKTHGFKYRPSDNSYNSIDFSGADGTTAYGVSNSENIIGRYWNSSGVYSYKYESSSSTFNMVMIPDISATSNETNGINNLEWLVGNYIDNTGNHGYRYDGTTLLIIDVANANWTEVYGADDSGNVVGAFSDYTRTFGFFFDGNTFTTIEEPPNTSDSRLYDINTSGEIVGSYDTHALILIPTTDNDGDGFPEPDDCKDNDDTVYPGAPELCDGKDNDCNGIVDDITNTYWVDGDGDGYGDPAFPADLIACSTPIGYSDNSDDCDDADSTVFPGAPELCDGKDNDCDGVVPAVEVGNDGDGMSECEGDCDNSDPTVYAGAPELCDGKDNDCDGVVPAVEVDNDGDGFSECEGDCNDADATINPAATDIPENGIDEDCNGEDLTWAEQIATTIDVINSLDPGVFDKPKDQDKLAKELEKTLKAIEEGKEKQAIKNLDKVLEETDGCALRGTPDTKGKKKMKNKEDSIQDCNAQALIYPLVLESIQLLGQHI